MGGRRRAGAAVVALAFAAVLGSCGGGGESGPSVDPTRTPTASPTRSATLPSPTRSPITSDSPTETDAAPEPSDSPADTESPPEPSDSPVASETPTPTPTSAPTEAATSEAAPPPTESTPPTTTDEPPEGDADEDSEDVPAWVWWLLAALALALAVGIPLLVRSRRSKSWKSDLAGAEQEVAWLVRDLLPSLQRTGSREQALGGWAVSSDRVLALDDRLTSLEATAPADSGRERARTLRDAVRVARGRMDSLPASATDQSASVEIGNIAKDLSSTVWPTEPQSPRP